MTLSLSHAETAFGAEVVFNVQGEREASLAAAARSMLSAFEPLLARLAEPAVPQAGRAASTEADAGGAGEGNEADDEATPMPAPLAAMLQVRWPGVVRVAGRILPALRTSPPTLLAPSWQTFDERWIVYLEQFVCWKSADAGEQCLHCCLCCHVQIPSPCCAARGGQGDLVG